MKKLQSVYLQTGTACNSRCTICPYKDTYAGKQIKYMSEETHHKILTDLGKDYDGEIGYYFQYEPLTDFRLPVFLYFNKLLCPKARTSISTNAGLLNEKWQHDLLENLDYVYFNILGGTKETYEKIMHGLKWETMLKNVNEFAEKFEGKMFVNFIKTNENKGEVENLRKLLNKKIDIISEYWASDRNKHIEIDKPKGAKTRFVTDKKCNVIEKGIYIHYDGKVPLCCEMWEREIMVGDVMKENIYDIFNSPKMNTKNSICAKCLLQ